VNSLADPADSGSEWRTPPAKIELGARELHVWRFALDGPEECRQSLWRTLTEDEQHRAQRFYFERHRRRFVMARGILRFLLGRYLRQAPERIQFGYGKYGKPVLEAGGDLHFNLSHSGDAALLGLTRGRELGIDLEQVRPRDHLEELTQRFFAPAEVAALAAVAPPDRELAFFQCWTRKEAFLKAGGDGLARPLDSFCVTLRPGEPVRLLAVEGDAEEAARWDLRTLTPWPGFVGCVAVRDHGWALRCWDGSGEFVSGE
jgi:4'-phosphopantetheinyl transferase